MFLNETKPPLDEALEHFGVPGMKWGHRKTSYSYEDFQPDKKKYTGAKVAGGLLLAAGAAATFMVLKNQGGSKVLTGVLIDAPKAARAASKVGDIIDGEVVSSRYTHYLKGASAMKALPPGVWKTPIAAIAS